MSRILWGGQRIARIATPVYRGQVRADYAVGALMVAVDLLQEGSAYGFDCVDICDDHLVQARNVLLARALESRADVLLWLDGDVALQYASPTELENLLSLAQGDTAVASAVCRRRGSTLGEMVDWERGAFAFVATDEQRAALRAGRTSEVERVGLGACAYNLHWWRRHAEQMPRGAAGELALYEWRGGHGEDYAACTFARERGGRVVVDPSIGTIHDGMLWPGTLAQREMERLRTGGAS